MVNMLKMMGLVLLFTLNQSAFAQYSAEETVINEYNNGDYSQDEYEDEDLDEAEAYPVEEDELEAPEEAEDVERQRELMRERYNEMRRRGGLGDTPGARTFENEGMNRMHREGGMEGMRGHR